MARRGAPPSRQRQAFESLLDPEYAPQSDTSETSGGQGKRERQRHPSHRQIFDKRGSDKIPGFTLRDAVPASQQSPSGLEQLSSMFGSIADNSVISEVLISCGDSVQAAAEILLEMSEHKQPQQSQQEQPASAAESVSQTSYWSWLPEECKGLVLKHLDSKDLAKAARTCKEFADHIRGVRAGLACLNIPPGMSRAAVQGMVAAYTGAHTVSLARCAGQLRHTVDFADMFAAVYKGGAARKQGPAIERLNLKGCIALRTDDVATLCDHFDSLRGLTLKCCEDIDDAAVVLLSKYTAAQSALPENLAALDLTTTSTEPAAASDATTFSDQRNVSLQRSFLGKTMVGLRHSEAPSNPHTHLQPVLNADSAADQQRSQNQRRQSAAGSMTGLESLCLAGCAKVTEKGVAALLKGSAAAHSLTCLDVSRCVGLSGNALDLTPKAPLKQLIANSCHGITSVELQLPTTAPLESVTVAGCRKLKRVYISATQLSSLAVDDCPQLHSLELLCPNLVTLSASKCAHQAMPLLTCPNLQQLNLFGCRQLQSEEMEEALDQLPNLIKLNVNGCIALTRLVLGSCTKLQWLDCSGCSRLHHIVSSSTALAYVSAVACPHLALLQEVSLQSIRVSKMTLANCAQLQRLSLPELDHAVAAQLAGPGAGSKSKAGSKERLRRRIDISGCDQLPSAVQHALS